MKKLLLILIGIIGIVNWCIAQRFEASILGGINITTLNEETPSSFIGTNVGLRGSINLHKNWQISTEILFSQNGDYILPVYYPPVSYDKVRLNYIEIPLHGTYRVKNKKRDYYNVYLNAGLAYAQLLNYSAETSTGYDASEEIVFDTKSALLLQTGMMYFFNDYVGLNLRWSFSTNSSDLSPTVAFRGVVRFG